MNNFTKEELKTLSDILTLDLDDINPSCQEELQNKLHLMIDNYCEHDSEGDWHVCVNKCKKCGVIVND